MQTTHPQYLLESDDGMIKVDKEIVHCCRLFEKRIQILEPKVSHMVIDDRLRIDRKIKDFEFHWKNSALTLPQSTHVDPQK